MHPKKDAIPTRTTSSKKWHAVFAVALALCLAAVLCITRPAAAQVSSAEILGTVKDPAGGVVPNAKVIATSLTTNLEYSANTDDIGNYLIRFVPPGHYSMRVEVPGFAEWKLADVGLAVGDRLRQDVPLRTSVVEQTVEVTAQTPALQT